MRAKRVGYTVSNESEQLYQKADCQEVVQTQELGKSYAQFEQFLLTYKTCSLVVVNFQSVGLQLIQWLPLLKIIKTNDISLAFIEKPVSSDQEYLAILFQLAQDEKLIISRRTCQGLKKAHANGMVSGRPTISEDVIHQIKRLHQQKKTLREISIECQVSLGTVHKYTKLIE